MAQYKTHAKFNLIVALPLLVTAIYFLIPFTPWTLGMFVCAFVYATLYMNPDLDLAHQIKFWSVRGFLTCPFRLYSKVFSHRGLSHSILFGTLTRVLFLTLLAIAGIWLFTQVAPNTNSLLAFLKTHQTILSHCFAGVLLADICHLILDI